MTIKVDKIYSKLINCGIEVFLDDRDLNPGIKFRDANLMGVPFQLVVSDKINDDSVELINRKNQKKEILKIDQIIDRIK